MRLAVDAFLLEHTANAFEEFEEKDGTLVFDFTHYANLDGLEGAVGGAVQGVVSAPWRGSLRRGRIDPARRSFQMEERLSQPVEMPRVSPHVDARPYRYMYLPSFSSPSHDTMSMWDAVMKLDMDRGTVERYAPGPDSYPSEAVFVPRRRLATEATAEAAAEDDGYLLTLVYDARADASHVESLDARSPSAGPVAKAHLDHPVPLGFHGSWAEAARAS